MDARGRVRRANPAARRIFGISGDPHGLSPQEVTRRQAFVDLVRRGRCDLVVNTPQGSGARADGYRIREAALAARVPCITTISGAAAAVHAIANARTEIARSLQERLQRGGTQGSPASPLLPAGRARAVAGAPAGRSTAPPEDTNLWPSADKRDA